MAQTKRGKSGKIVKCEYCSKNFSPEPYQEPVRDPEGKIMCSKCDKLVEELRKKYPAGNWAYLHLKLFLKNQSRGKTN